MNGERTANIRGTAVARQRGAAATTEPDPGGSGPAALLPGTLVANAGIRRRISGVPGARRREKGKVAGGVAPLGHGKRDGARRRQVPASGNAGNGGRVRSERQRTEPPGHLSPSQRPPGRRNRRRASGVPGLEPETICPDRVALRRSKRQFPTEEPAEA